MSETARALQEPLVVAVDAINEMPGHEVHLQARLFVEHLPPNFR